MASNFTYVPYRETGYFSRLATDYLDQHEDIKPFFVYSPDASGIEKAIEDRGKFLVNRELLVETLSRQYSGLTTYPKTESNIQLLLNENTYTICTAHQPNLLTGYLYFIYKILHAIKLAEELSATHSDKHFVPVYYMGSEDNDIEELGTFRFRGEKYVWDGDGQSGAVGRMKTKGLKSVVNELFKTFGPPGKNCEGLQAMISAAYLQHETVGAATQFLVNELFGRYGLVILNPDEPALKAAFTTEMADELLQGNSYQIVSAQIDKLSVQYKAQAQPRPINLFYLTDNMRERIEKQGDAWTVVNTDIRWTQEQVLTELREHPERFSPNVVLRGLFQERILPNVAFIGGGAEVAYWLQLKTLFAHYGVFYPCILLRQSVLWIRPSETKLRNQLEFSTADIFKQEEVLFRAYISKHATEDWHTNEETESIEAILQALKQKAASLDPTLVGSAEAALAKMRHQLTILEKKMLSAAKKKMNVHVERIKKLRKILFPGNSLQERIENFSEYYLEYDDTFFDTVKEGIIPLGNEFLVIELKGG